MRIRNVKLKGEQLGFVEDEDGTIKIEDLTIPPALPPTLSTEAPDSRLVIHSLVVKNFKSYAGEQILGPFHKNFTAVVGPNGSGKSNVIDSLLFVFGYRAKKIRSKKVSNLIHKSDQYPDCESCSVTVNFAYIKDQGEKGVIIPDSRFSLSRTAFQDDSSYYEICNKRVPYKEVSKTLRKYGIDLEHSRFLILQGEIEAIALMNPKAQNEHETGMLEYVEDIIGSNRFIEPIKHFELKAEELNRIKNEKAADLKLVEEEKKSLEKPRNEAVEYLRLQNKLITKENALYHLRCFEAEKCLKDTVESKQKFMENMKSLKSELESLRASKKKIETSLSEISREHELFQKKSDEIKEEYSKLEHEDAANLMLIKHSKEKVQKLESSLEGLNKELSKLAKQSSVYEQETGELLEKKKKWEEEKEIESKKMEEMMGSLKQETKIMQEKKDKLEEELVKLKNNSYQIKSEMDLAQSELKLINREQIKEKEKLDALISNHEKSVQSTNSEEKLMKSESENLKVIENEVADYQKQLEQLRIEEAELMQQLKRDRIKLEEARIAQSNSSCQGTIAKAFLKEKLQGRLTGVYGRLGDLGAIDEKYDVAISTACGPLDNIVTDTLNTAQECVEFLKKNNLGYTTFIPLEKMKIWERQANTKISTPEGVPRLFDLIRVKNKDVLPAFYYALKDTLVAKDLEQATRIGLQGHVRYRVVTLKGDLIDLAGTMSGGGGKVFKGRMGQTVVENAVTKEDVNKLSAEVNSMNQKFITVRKQRLNLEELISQKTSISQSLQHSLKKRAMNFNAYKESINVLSSQIADQKLKCKETVVDVKQVKELENKIKERRKVYNEAVEKESVVEKQVSKLQEEILQVTKGKFNKVKKNLNLLDKKLSEVTQALTKSNVNTKTSKRNLKKVEDKIKAIEEDIKGSKEAVEHLRKQQLNLTDKGKELVQLIEQNNAKISSFKEKRAELKKEMDAVLEQEHKLKLSEIELKNQLKSYEADESEKRAFIRTINAKLSKLELNEVEDDPTELPSLSKEEISKLSVAALTSEIDIIKVQLEPLKPNLSSIGEYNIKLRLFEEKQSEVNKITEEKTLQSNRSDYLSNRRVSEFVKGFTIIAKKLKEIYQMLTLGGDAEIELADTTDPFSKGIEFGVRPPKKSWKYMKNLSGGEKTLSSLSLVFALHYYRPTPFYVMDEIDAALDVRNVAIVGKYLKETTKNTQFIIVSLRNVMNELSDHLLGIYKTENCTKNINLSYASKWYEEEKNIDEEMDIE